MAEIRVPTLGESVTEATVSRWLKKVGDSIAVDDPIVELETDKVTLEVNATAAGTLSEIIAKEGDTVGVGATLGTIGAGGGAAAAKPAAAPAAAAAPAPAAAAPAPAAAPAGGAPHNARQHQGSNGVCRKAQPCGSIHPPVFRLVLAGRYPTKRPPVEASLLLEPLSTRPRTRVTAG